MGTEYKNMGRYYDGDLVRWFQGDLRPIGGWSSLSAGLVGTCRAGHSWVDNSADGHAVLGTNSHLYELSPGGVRTDITPTAYTAQDADESTWMLDNAGALLVGVNDGEGQIYTWLPGDAVAAPLTNSPSADGVVVTNEGIIMALGSAGNPRQISWCDKDDFTDWSAGPTDLAGDLIIQARAPIQCAHNIRAGTLIWTEEDLHVVRYYGLPDVYGVTRVAEDCGAISRGCVVVVDDLAFWMGPSGFHICNGGSFVEALNCAVHDDVFENLDRSQAHKVRAVHISEFNEVWWLYRQGDDAGTDNTRVVVFNYKEGHWSLHDLARDCGIGRGSGFDHPVMVGGVTAWSHESGTSMTGAGTPYAQSGPVEIGNGERIMNVLRYIPDERASGELDVYFYSRPFPNAAEIAYGPYAAANPVNLRFLGRQVAVRFEQSVANNWRQGHGRVEAIASGRR